MTKVSMTEEEKKQAAEIEGLDVEELVRLLVRARGGEVEVPPSKFLKVTPDNVPVRQKTFPCAEAIGMAAPEGICPDGKRLTIVSMRMIAHVCGSLT